MTVMGPLMVAVIQLVGTALAARGGGAAPGGLAIGALLIGPAALVVRRRLPVTALVVTLLLAIGYQVSAYPHGVVFLSVVVAVFGAAHRVRRETIWTVVGAGYLSLLALAVITHVNRYAVLSLGSLKIRLDPPSVAGCVAVGLVLAIAVTLAEAARVRAEHFREMGRVRAAADQARKEQARRQASDERLRIAQELHDVLGHHLSLINVRAGVALHLLDSQPDQTREALEAIKQASAEALREVRGVLATLSPEQPEPAPRTPTQGLADLADLAATARAAGLPVRLVSEGTPRAVPPELDRAVYRVAQEALTNIRRHAGPGARGTIRLEWADETLRLVISNVGSPGSVQTDGAGNGIPGMRERATALGGTLSARPTADGFEVRATLPIRNEAAP
jgi:signal transduction histidine kinase